MNFLAIRDDTRKFSGVVQLRSAKAEWAGKGQGKRKDGRLIEEEDGGMWRLLRPWTVGLEQ